MVARLVVAAPSSGAGKTTIATGLMAALVQAGLTVSPHKAGPDYIDPGYHALATGRPGRNLDPFLTSEDLVAPLFLHGARGADIAIVEGVMGLFDGLPDGYASTAHVARLIDAPVVLVVDATGQGQSVAALVHGFAGFDTRVRIGGVILNRVGSDRHEEVCRAALDHSGVPVLGVIRRTPGIETPSRHLGLIPVAERRREAVEAVARLGDLVTEGCDLKALVRLAHTAPMPAGEAWSPEAALAGCSGDAAHRSERRTTTKVAVAGGPAFTFGYAEQTELLQAAGAEVVPFDPLRDERLPEGAGGLILPGGFPEMHVQDLAANEPLKREIAAFGGPILAECGGLLYLARELDGHPMVGRIDAKSEMSPRLTLGYRDAVVTRDTIIGRTGERVRGHEFHRTVTDLPGERVYRWRGGADGYAAGRILASYLHLHWAGTPEAATRFVKECG
ncbi:cobyrinate a,c-diamide synthase [Herbidospora sp. NBRC 101105]|uniref:cobyrinate a,c-diamide synthase n=1 Tax=Herbidospora sp. NBRC 101105 TaxID=3032195 RepID=UPI0024A2ED3B|nr:cobyrinate a,c-diamide synthase [Herbidospora sp. NBRC 101105]GLX97005.1 hydrogenobyrinate a,c-diamide synthase [Herbidospora sp. NBRC 101105]